MNSRVSTCFLCNSLLDRGGYVDFGEGIRATGDLAPLQVGHTLLFHRDHYLSFARVPSVSWERVQHIAIELQHFWQTKRIGTVFFEHGPRSEGSNFVGCCDHAHLHCLPLGPDLSLNHTAVLKAIDHELEAEIAMGRVKSIGDVSYSEVSALEDKEYFWFSADMRTLRVFELMKPERQFMRRVASSVLGQRKFLTWDMVNELSASDAVDSLRKLKI